MTAKEIIEPKIHFVTGKGGVGKSSVAYAMAQSLAKIGQRVLLVELGQVSHYQHHILKSKSDIERSVSVDPLEIEPNLFVVLWSGEYCLREYLTHLIHFKKLVDLFFNHRVTKTLVKAAPALKELSILGKITSGIRNFGPKLEFDQIVVDSFSTGHFLALLRVPKAMGELVKLGPMGKQCSEIQAVLTNSKVCKYYIVTLAEELPITEAVEMYQVMVNEFALTPTVIINKWIGLDIGMEDFQRWKNSLKLGTCPAWLDCFVSEVKAMQASEIRVKEIVRHKVGSSLIAKMVLDGNASDQYESLSKDMDILWKS